MPFLTSKFSVVLTLICLITQDTTGGSILSALVEDNYTDKTDPRLDKSVMVSLAGSGILFQTKPMTSSFLHSLEQCSITITG